MEEYFFSGYCRAMDSSRTVTVEIEGDSAVADCDYGTCPWTDACQIGAKIRQQSQ